ncbi:DMATS type aromatic prenyltransferase [Aspergillus varians]
MTANVIESPSLPQGAADKNDIVTVTTWLKKLAPLFTKMLATGDYSPAHKQLYMNFLAQTLIPLMGPYPQTFRSAVTRSGLPIEFSANYTQKSSVGPVWRIGFEPVGSESGSPHDPYNQTAMGDLLKQLANLDLPGYDTTLFEHFLAAHTVNKAEREALKGKRLEGSDISPTQVAFGFDLKGGQISVKGYSFPALKCKVTGLSFATIFRQSIEPLTEKMGKLPSFNMVNEYMDEIDGWSNFTFCSWDCVAPIKSRLKLYSSTNLVTWSKIEEIWTLGGRVSSDEALQGLQFLKRLWELTRLKEGYRAFTGGFDDGTDSTPTPILWNYEVKPGASEPLTKIYFPIHGENDLTIVQGLATFLEEIGLVREGQTYEQTVRHYYPERDLNKTACLTSWLSFAYSEKTGVYLSVYYHSSLDYPWAEQEGQ